MFLKYLIVLIVVNHSTVSAAGYQSAIPWLECADPQSSYCCIGQSFPSGPTSQTGTGCFDNYSCDTLAIAEPSNSSLVWTIYHAINSGNDPVAFFVYFTKGQVNVNSSNSVPKGVLYVQADLNGFNVNFDSVNQTINTNHSLVTKRSSGFVSSVQKNFQVLEFTTPYVINYGVGLNPIYSVDQWENGVYITVLVVNETQNAILSKMQSEVNLIRNTTTQSLSTSPATSPATITANDSAISDSLATPTADLTVPTLQSTTPPKAEEESSPEPETSRTMVTQAMTTTKRERTGNRAILYSMLMIVFLFALLACWLIWKKRQENMADSFSKVKTLLSLEKGFTDNQLIAKQVSKSASKSNSLKTSSPKSDSPGNKVFPLPSAGIVAKPLVQDGAKVESARSNIKPPEAIKVQTNVAKVQSNVAKVQ
ncbi:hypothetical protein HDE_00318 [Halotydeus destructor]|nr:hypothetical protein HDE_00318 [Halotydeus destructor]